MVLPEDPDDQAELRLAALRECLRTGEKLRRLSPGYMHDPLSRRWALETWGDLYTVMDQLQVLQDQGALTVTDNDPKQFFIRLTVIGRQWARHGDGREAQRRRLKILRYLNQKPEYYHPRMAMVEATGLDDDQVGKDLRFLHEVKYVTASWTADNTPHPGRARITGTGVQIAEEGWPDNMGISAGTTYNTTFTGSVGNAAVGNSGPVTQIASEDAGLRQTLSELTDAISALDRSIPENSAAMAISEQIMAAVDAPDRDLARTSSLWTYLGRFADALQIAGGPTTVKALYDQAEPLMRALLTVG